MVIIMANLRYQKRLVSRITKKGTSRVWIDPREIKNAEEAITASDVKRLISSGTIKLRSKNGNSSFRIKKARAQKRKGRRRGPGSLKGTFNARSPRKMQWIRTARILRADAKKLRDDGAITTIIYRDLYGKIKGGFFRNRKHMAIYLERNALVNKKGE